MYFYRMIYIKKEIYINEFVEIISTFDEFIYLG